VRLARACALIARHPREALLVKKYRRHTMVPSARAIENLALCHSRPPGDLVECGCWQGGMIAAISELTARRAVLFDSFEGLSPARDIDGPAAMASQSDTSGTDYHDNCPATEHEPRRVMRLARTDYEIYKGWFSDTVPRYARPGNRISILRLDGDWYDSTVLCLNHLFPLVAPGEGCPHRRLRNLGWLCACRARLPLVGECPGTDRSNARGVAFIVKHARD
jgi:hypothetical protein